MTADQPIAVCRSIAQALQWKFIFTQVVYENGDHIYKQNTQKQTKNITAFYCIDYKNNNNKNKNKI